LRSVQFSKEEKYDKGDILELFSLPGYGWNGEWVKIKGDSHKKVEKKHIKE